MSSEPAARKPPEDVKDQYKKLISREFRDLQLAQDLKTKSIFDLIDYCELLYEKLVEYTDSDSGLKAYMRGYLIFNYFINCFIMLHFQGFDKFIESNEPDFILYLNVFAFYNTKDVIRDRGHSLSLELVRQWIIEFLTDQKLLSFDVQELYDWLYQYIDYLKQKDQEEFQSDDLRSANGVTYAQPSIEYDRQSLNLFEERFPSVDLPSNSSPNNGSFDFISPELKAQSFPTPPYPVNSTFTRSPTPPYPLDDEKGVSTDDLYFSSNVQPPVQPRPKQLPPPIPNATPVQLETSYEARPYMSSNQSFPHGYSQSAQYQRNPVPQPANHIHQPPPRGNEQYYSNHNGYTHNGHTHGRLMSRDMGKYTICGLKNFGSTCYINLTIQLLFGLYDFSLIFENQGYLKYVKNPKYVKLLQQRHPTKDSGLLSEAIFSLLKTFKDHPQASIAPTKFLRVSSLLKPDLNIPYEQQDSQEFLLFVLEMLHNELGSKAFDETEWENDRIGRYMTKWGINVSPEDREPYISWYRSLLKLEGFSPIHDLFQGHLQSKLICNKCGFESSNYSPFTILSLPIPLGHGHRVDLADCLRYYTKDEILTGENAWKCPKCSKNISSPLSSSVLDSHPVFATKKSGLFKLGRRSKSPSKKPQNGSQTSSTTSLGSTTKKLNFIKLPKILFMHLSRFSMTSVTDKLDTVIKYPLQITFNNNTNNSNHEITYKLTGIINHYGTLKSGHYTALVNKSSRTSGMDSLRDPCWCFFDDEQVRIKVRHGDAADPHGEYRELNSRDVYVLCYERV